VRALLLTGTVGVGKTVVAIEAGDQLARGGHHPAVLDLDWLAWLNNRVGVTADELLLQNLRAVWPNFVTAGADCAVMARVVLNPAFVPAVAEALDAEVAVVRLAAPVPVLRERLTRRDQGAELDEHLHLVAGFDRRAAAAVPEAPAVATAGRSIAEIAAEVLRLAGF
jgi:hypothetical protein